jgi:hypothetical protein
LLFCVCIGVHGCGDSPRGGAVELSWALRDRSKGFVACDSPANPNDSNVTHIRLDWKVGELTGSSRWPCDNNGERRGVTLFEVPVGTASLAISPECSDGPADPASYAAPPPIIRQVELGGIVTLGAVVIQIELAPTDSQARICPPP